MADSTGRLPKSELAYDCIVNESRRHQPTYADGRAAHRGDMVAIAGEPGHRMYKVEALHPDRREVQITDTLGAVPRANLLDQVRRRIQARQTA